MLVVFAVLSRYLLVVEGSSSALATGSGDGYLVADEVEGGSYTMTGGAYDFKRATSPLTYEILSAPKKVTLLRHGLSSWNDESRIQVRFLLCLPHVSFARLYISCLQLASSLRA